MEYIKYIVLSRQNATDRNNNPYATLKTAYIEEGNVKNEIIRIFEIKPEEGPTIGQVVEFYRLQDFQGTKTARRTDLKETYNAPKGDPLYNLVPRPIEAEKWAECIDNLCKMSSDEKLIEVIQAQKTILYDKYKEYPAATTVHHAYPGGLLNHTYQMLHMLEGIYPTMTPYNENIKIERCILAIMFHDYGKTSEYEKNGDCRKEMYLLGHIYMSAQMVNSILVQAKIDKEETRLIVHCVLAHHGELEFGSPVKPCTPEAQLVNYLDNISAKADIFNTTGNMEKSFFLGTHVVKE